MSDNKKYYYLKLKDNFFDSDEVIVLESMPDGYLYSNILLKLYLRSLKNEGRLMFNDKIPYNSTMLAQITRHQVGTVEKAVQTLKEIGLIEILDNGAIYISDIQNFIGQSSTEADRKRAYRERISNETKLLNGQMSDQMSGQMEDKNPPEIEKEKELKKEKDIYKETRHKYGEYKNILLTDKQYNKLLKDFGEDALLYLIALVDEGIQMKGYKYKDFNLALRKWAKNDKTITKNTNEWMV